MTLLNKKLLFFCVFCFLLRLSPSLALSLSVCLSVCLSVSLSLSLSLSLLLSLSLGLSHPFPLLIPYTSLRSFISLSLSSLTFISPFLSHTPLFFTLLYLYHSFPLPRSLSTPSLSLSLSLFLSLSLSLSRPLLSHLPTLIYFSNF